MLQVPSVANLEGWGLGPVLSAYSAIPSLTQVKKAAERTDFAETSQDVPALARDKRPTRARPAAGMGPAGRALRRPRDQAADFTSIFLTWAGAGLGTTTLSTPLSMLALMASALTPSGSSSERSNEP